MISIFKNKNDKSGDKSLAGKTALITGASRGIGAAAAKALAARGAHVVLLARTIGALEEVDDVIQAAGGSATLLPFDLSETNKIGIIGEAIAGRFGKLDILIANAAMLGALSPVASSDTEVYEETFKVNFFSNYHLIRTLDPLLRNAPAGRAVFVTTTLVHRSMPFWSPYASSKAALEHMALTYAAEVAYSPLKVNLFDPGPVRTALRAEALPAEDTSSLPAPEQVVEKLVTLVSDQYTDTGKIIKAA